jgi:hypothetical protein
MKLKLFLLLVGLNFLFCCLFLAMLHDVVVSNYRIYHDGWHLPGWTECCSLLIPWLKYLGAIGMSYPVFALFRKTVKMEEALLYSGVIFFAQTILFFTVFTSALFPWLPIHE